MIELSVLCVIQLMPFRCSLHVTVPSDHAAGDAGKVKCFRSINEIKAAVSASRKPMTITPLRATHLTFTSIDVM
jgi:hypothetical protein